MKTFKDLTLNTPIYWIDEELDWGAPIIHRSFPVMIKKSENEENFIHVYVNNNTRQQNEHPKEEDDLHELYVNSTLSVDSFEWDDSFSCASLTFEDAKNEWLKCYDDRITSVLNGKAEINKILFSAMDLEYGIDAVFNAYGETAYKEYSNEE